MKKMKVLFFVLVLGLGFNACSLMYQVEADHIYDSQYPEFSEAYLERMPPTERLIDILNPRSDAVQMYFDETSLSIPLDLKGNLYSSRLSNTQAKATLLRNYRASGISEENLQLQSFLEICKEELNLKVKAYDSKVNKAFLLSFPVVTQSLDSDAYMSYELALDVDKTYVAYDENGKAKVIFAYYHNFSGDFEQTIHEAFAVVFYGDATDKIMSKAAKAFEENEL